MLYFSYITQGAIILVNDSIFYGALITMYDQYWSIHLALYVEMPKNQSRSLNQACLLSVFKTKLMKFHFHHQHPDLLNCCYFESFHSSFANTYISRNGILPIKVLQKIVLKLSIVTFCWRKNTFVIKDQWILANL